MIQQVLINTPDVSDDEIADFVYHKGREIRNPKTSFMACLSAVVVGATVDCGSTGKGRGILPQISNSPWTSPALTFFLTFPKTIFKRLKIIFH
jgi:hypothetical protein